MGLLRLASHQKPPHFLQIRKFHFRSLQQLRIHFHLSFLEQLLNQLKLIHFLLQGQVFHQYYWTLKSLLGQESQQGLDHFQVLHQSPARIHLPLSQFQHFHQQFQKVLLLQWQFQQGRSPHLLSQQGQSLGLKIQQWQFQQGQSLGFQIQQGQHLQWQFQQGQSLDWQIQ